jgi:hypothetical protein
MEAAAAKAWRHNVGRFHFISKIAHARSHAALALDPTLVAPSGAPGLGA